MYSTDKLVTMQTTKHRMHRSTVLHLQRYCMYYFECKSRHRIRLMYFIINIIHYEHRGQSCGLHYSPHTGTSMQPNAISPSPFSYTFISFVWIVWTDFSIYSTNTSSSQPSLLFLVIHSMDSLKVRLWNVINPTG